MLEYNGSEAWRSPIHRGRISIIPVRKGGDIVLFVHDIGLKAVWKPGVTAKAVADLIFKANRLKKRSGPFHGTVWYYHVVFWGLEIVYTSRKNQYYTMCLWTHRQIPLWTIFTKPIHTGSAALHTVRLGYRFCLYPNIRFPYLHYGFSWCII